MSRRKSNGRKWQKRRIQNSDDVVVGRLRDKDLELISTSPEDFGFSDVIQIERDVPTYIGRRRVGQIDVVIKTLEGEVYLVQYASDRYGVTKQDTKDQLALALAEYKREHPEVDPTKVHPYVIFRSNGRFKGVLV